MIKKLLAILVLCSGFAAAAGTEINKSSFTTTNDSTQRIAERGAVLYAIVVGSPTFGGLITVYDNRNATTNPVARVLTTVPGSYLYNVYMSSGLTYTTSGTPSNGISILYR